jgi:hypothetical protein
MVGSRGLLRSNPSYRVYFLACICPIAGGSVAPIALALATLEFGDGVGGHLSFQAGGQPIRVDGHKPLPVSGHLGCWHVAIPMLVTAVGLRRAAVGDGGLDGTYGAALAGSRS